MRWGVNGAADLRRGMIAVAAASAVLLASSVRAEPILQIYIEGATYDASPGVESWVFEPDPGQPLRLWTIGNISGGGGKGDILDVRLSIVYDSFAGDSVVFDLIPGTTGGYGGYYDPSTPSDPTLLQTNDAGDLPQLGDGSDLAPHGQYGLGRTWHEFSLGDFNDADSPLDDFITSFPTQPAGAPAEAQINVYEVQMLNAPSDGLTLHFDLYNHVEGGNHGKVWYKFAPFSHDGDGTPPGDDETPPAGIPTPAAAPLALLTFAGLATRRLRWR